MKYSVYILLLLSIIISPSLVSADDVTDVQTRVTQIQDTDPSLPSISEQKGIYGTILSKLFTSNGKIKDVFLQIVGSLSSGNVPRWDGSQLVSGVITDNGTNVGIGVASPQKILHVAGGFPLFTQNNGSNNATFLNEGGQASTVELYTDTSNNDRALITKIGSTHVNTQYRNDVFVDNIVGGVTVGRITLDVTGNVGIWEEIPQYKLDVAGNIRAQSRHLFLGANDVYGDNSSGLFYDSNHSTVTQMVFRDAEDAQYGKVYGDNNGADFGLTDGDGDWGVRMNTNNYTSFSVNSSEKMRILSNGNIGIGTTSPIRDLDVRKNEEIQIAAHSSNTNQSASILTTVDGKQNFYFGVNPSINAGVIGISNTSSDLAKPGQNDVITINGSGYIGIGETNPGTKLHVKSGDSGGSYVPTSNSVGIFESNANAFIDVTTPGTSSAGIRFDTGGNSEGYVAYDGSPDNLRFGTNANDRMIITGDGKVGIGTTNPTFADWPSATGLHIQGSRAVLGLEGTAGARKWDVGVDNAGQFVIYDDTANSSLFWLNTNGNTHLRNWLILGTGGEGIYSATNSAHFYPNTVSDFGTWRIHGTRGGWAGINYNNATTMMLHDSHAGFYNDGDNEWLAYGSRNGAFYLMHNGSTKLETRSDGVQTYGAHYASSFIYTSDERLKTNIKDISGLDIIRKLHGVKFTWKKNKQDSYGLIAQEVEQVLPELVHTGDNGMKSVEYGNLVAPLIEAVKEQQSQIEKLQDQIIQLQAQVGN